jgi:uracil phosphoribosyltransferase
MTEFIHVENDRTRKYLPMLWNQADVRLKRKAAMILAQELVNKIKKDLSVKDTRIHFLHIMRDAIVFIFASWLVTPLARNSTIYHDRKLLGDEPQTELYSHKVDQINQNDELIITDCVVCSGATQEKVLKFLDPKVLRKVTVAIFVGTEQGFKKLEKLGVAKVYYIAKSRTSPDGKRLEPPIFPLWDIGDNFYFTRVDIAVEGAPEIS